MMLHQSSPVALQCRMSALKGELMSVVPRGKIEPIGFASGWVEGSEVSAEQAKRIRRYIRNTVAYLGHLK